MKQKSLRAFSLVLIFALCLSLLSACDGEKVNILAEANSEPISNESKDMAYYAKTLLDEKNPLGIVGSVCPADGGIYIEGKTINYTDGTFKSALYFAEKNGEIKSVNSDWLGESNITGMCAAEGGGFWLVKSTYLSKDNAEHELGYFETGEYSRLSELEKTDKMFIQGLCAAKGRIFISESDARGTNLIKAYKPGGEKDFEVNVGGTNFDFVGDGALLYIGKHD